MTALDVRRACLNPDTVAKINMKPICELTIPETRRQMEQQSKWTAWTNLFQNPAVDPARLIQQYSDSLDEEAVRAADVLDLVAPAERAAILARLGRNAGALREAVLGLHRRERAELIRGIFELRGELAALATDSAASEVADTVANVLQADIARATARGIGGLTEHSLDSILRARLPQLETSKLLLLISSRPDTEKAILTRLLGTRSVSDLMIQAPGTESVRLAATTQQQLAGTQPVSGARTAALASNIAWGVSDFVVERVEQQLRTYAVRGLASRICQEVGAVLLRESCLVLESSQFGISSAGTGMLRSAVRRDLERLPATALAWTYQEYDGRLDDPSRDRIQVVIRGVGFALQVSRGSDPWLALASAADSLVPGYRAAVQTELDRLKFQRDSLIAVLRAPESQPQAIRSLEAQVRSLQQRAARRAGVIIPQHLEPGQFPLSSVLADLSALYATRFDRLRIRPAVWTEDVARSLLHAQLVAMLANARSDAGGLSSVRQFQPWRFAPVALVADEELGRIQALRLRLDSLRRGAQIDTVRIRIGRIELAQGAFSALDHVLAEVQRANLADVTGAQRALAVTQNVVMPLVEGDYGAAVLGVRDQVAELAPGLADPGSDAGWMRGLTFVSELSGAGSADQVNAALVRLTEGGQGFEAKRDWQEWRLGLNAFGGIYGGADWGGFSRERAGSENSAFAGLYLPVGLALTAPWAVKVPLFGRLGRLGTFGVFAQVVDLGALASWRLEEGENVDQRPEVDVGQVFSPGFFGVLNIRRVPVSIGYGWSYAPQLRRSRDLSDDDDGEDATLPPRLEADRRGLFIAMDIPLFP